MGVIIDTPQLFMEIKLVSIESLFTHEETIPSALEQLKQELISEQILKHPIIVDSKTLVVLDGMHRVAALRNLGFLLVPVCLVDYQNPAIELFAWYREFDGEPSFTELINEIQAKRAFTFRLTSTIRANKVVKTRKVMAALANGDEAFSLRPQTELTIKAIYDEISEIEILAQTIGFHLIYSTESDAMKSLRSESRPVLIVPSLSKEEVITSALKKELFTQKTTRHVVPARPLFVNIPLSWLKQSNVKKANDQLCDYLKTQQIVKKEPGSIINGRRYEEYSYLFSEQ